MSNVLEVKDMGVERERVELGERKTRRELKSCEREKQRLGTMAEF